MGNAVFRYFLIWLRQEMRHEAYEEIVKRAERRAKRQQQVAPQQQGGWLSVVTSGLDELWQSYFAEEPPPPDASDAPADKHWQFWELAKHEGDERYMEWMEKHLWTYVGLSAPLLGAVNPLRSVISGENMGLPFSDEMARQLELSESIIHVLHRGTILCSWCWLTNDSHLVSFLLISHCASAPR